jgi:hypothetical protein
MAGIDTPVYWRDHLPADAEIAGPAIIEQMDTTIVIEPGDHRDADQRRQSLRSYAHEVQPMLDPITLAVIQAGLQQVCDEMDLSFSRAAFSPVIAEADDRSDGIYSATDGSLIAQGSRPACRSLSARCSFRPGHIIERIATGLTARRAG